MRHGILALALLSLTSACLAADLSVGPYSSDSSYGAWPQPACDACMPGVNPALSHSLAIVAPPAVTAWPELSWLKVRVNGRMTPLGQFVAYTRGEAMIPVTAAAEFGLTATRSGDNHRVITLAGGDKKVVLTIGSRAIKVGDATFQLPVAPMWMRGKVYMPVLALGLIGWRIEVDGKTGIVQMSSM